MPSAGSILHGKEMEVPSGADSVNPSSRIRLARVKGMERGHFVPIRVEPRITSSL